MKQRLFPVIFLILLLPMKAGGAKPLLKPVPSGEPIRAESIVIEPSKSGGKNGYEIVSDAPLRAEGYLMPEIRRFVVDIGNVADEVEPSLPTDQPVRGVRRLMVQRKEINSLSIRRFIFDLLPGYGAACTISPDGRRITVTVSTDSVPGVEQPAPPQTRRMAPVVPSGPALSAPSVSPPSRRLVGVETVSNGIRLVTGAPVDPLALFTLSAPPRLVIDLPPIPVSLPKETPVKRHGIRSVRVGSGADKVRVVLDGSGSTFPEYRLHPESNAIRILLKER